MFILLGVWALGYLLPSLLIGFTLGTTVPSWLAFAHVYVLFGVYFVWYWRTSGQTLAMQTWHVKLVQTDGLLLTRAQALKRYAYASLWLIPTIVIYALLRVTLNGSLGLWPTIELMFAMALFFWPLSCFLDFNNPLGRQSLVDRISGSRLIQIPKTK